MTNLSNIKYAKHETLNDLLQYVNLSFADWPNYIFRGHADSSWKLEPTLTRVLKRVNYPHKAELIKEHLERFKLEIRGRRGMSPRNLSENELWALGQHYGLYTPLLDWTQSPYVALFFSLVDAKIPGTGYRTLWAFHHPDIEAINEYYKTAKKNQKKYQVELINPILDENSRLVNQNGLFTRLEVGNDMETWVNKGPEINWLTLYKIDFPDSMKDRLLCYLDLMNISFSTLFPDLVGSSLNSNSKLEQTDYFVQTQNEIWVKSGSKRKS